MTEYLHTAKVIIMTEDISKYQETISNGIPEESSSIELRRVNPDLWEKVKQQESGRDKLAEGVTEKTRAAGLSPQQVREILIRFAEEKQDINLTEIPLSPKLTQAYGTVGISLAEDPNSPFRFGRLNTLKLAIDNAEEIIEVDTYNNTPPRVVYYLPYASFSPAETAEQKMVGARIRTLTTLRVTKPQADSIRTAINSAPRTQ